MLGGVPWVLAVLHLGMCWRGHVCFHPMLTWLGMGGQRVGRQRELLGAEQSTWSRLLMHKEVYVSACKFHTHTRWQVVHVCLHRI
jgi:hypothetical protein